LNNKLTKEERLHSKKLANLLFSEGKSFFQYPFKVFFISENNTMETPARLMVTIPKRSFKKAVDRNQIKRLVKECYRLHKNELVQYLNNHNKTLIFGLVYVGETILSYREVERKLILILQRLIEQDEEHIG